MIDAHILINLAALSCASLILWRTEPALARMDDRTHWMMRYAMLLLAGGSIGIILGVVTGAMIDIQTMIMLAGIALLLICERRLRYLTQHRPRSRCNHA